MKPADLVVAITGASGAPYGVRLLEVLLAAGRTVHLSVSPAACQVIATELGRSLQLHDFRPADLFGPEISDRIGANFDRLRYHHSATSRPASPAVRF